MSAPPLLERPDHPARRRTDPPGTDPPDRPRRWDPRQWSLWRLPTAAAHYVVVVDAGYVAVLAATAATLTFRATDLAAFGVCGAMGWVAKRASPRLGPPGPRRDQPHRDLLSAWTLPVALLLPPFYVLALHLPLYVRFRAGKGRPAPYKQFFNAAALGLSGFLACIAHAALAPVHGSYDVDSLTGSPERIAALFAGAIVFNLVNRILLEGIFLRLNPQVGKRTLGDSRDKFAIDATEMCSGIVVAVLWAVTPALLLAAGPPVVMLQRSLLHAELLDAARTDAKTRLANPAHWREVADREILRSRRSGRPLSVLIVDIDHFKAVNDTYGHLAGDEVLIAVANVLRGSMRPHDLVGRFGGEEFVVLLADVDVDGAARAAERIRFHVAAMRAMMAGLPPLAVTVSVGVATSSGPTTDLADLLEHADAALYRAKADGRNRVRLASGVPSQRPA